MNQKLNMVIVSREGITIEIKDFEKAIGFALEVIGDYNYSIQKVSGEEIGDPKPYSNVSFRNVYRYFVPRIKKDFSATQPEQIIEEILKLLDEIYIIKKKNFKTEKIGKLVKVDVVHQGCPFSKGCFKRKGEGKNVEVCPFALFNLEGIKENYAGEEWDYKFQLGDEKNMCAIYFGLWNDLEKIEKIEREKIVSIERLEQKEETLRNTQKLRDAIWVASVASSAFLVGHPRFFPDKVTEVIIDIVMKNAVKENDPVIKKLEAVKTSTDVLNICFDYFYREKWLNPIIHHFKETDGKAEMEVERSCRDDLICKEMNARLGDEFACKKAGVVIAIMKMYLNLDWDYKFHYGGNENTACKIEFFSKKKL